jgi:tetrahydromethanopterin S-methyltransferase subunit G
MELEVDIHKALVAKDTSKLEKNLKKLEKEKLELSKSEVSQLKRLGR